MAEGPRAIAADPAAVLAGFAAIQLAAVLAGFVGLIAVPCDRRTKSTSNCQTSTVANERIRSIVADRSTDQRFEFGAHIADGRIRKQSLQVRKATMPTIIPSGFSAVD